MSDASKPFSWATPASESLRRAYRVQLPSGHIKKMSLDELDVAYRGSLIDEGSFVLTEGSTQWTTLGELLEAADAAPPSPPVTSLAPPPVVTDLAVDIPVDVARDDVDIAIPAPPPRRSVGRALAAVALFTLAASGAFAAVNGKALWPRAEPTAREGNQGGATLAVAAPARAPEPPSPAPAPPPPEPTPIVVVPADDAEVAAKESSRPSKIKKSTKGGGRKRGTTKRAHPSPKKKAKKPRAESSPFTGM